MSLLPPIAVPNAVVERFREHFTPTGAGECWAWTGSRLTAGYGRIKHAGRTYRAHRVAYELAIGPIPDGLHLDHLCHTRDVACPGGNTCPHRGCVNPAHLEPVTPAVNTMRGRGLGARNAAKTHCGKGHEFTDENTQLTAKGGRRCKACAGLTGRGQGWPWTAVTHCPQGHPYSEENTYRSGGARFCRTCSRVKSRAAYHARKAGALDGAA